MTRPSGPKSALGLVGVILGLIVGVGVILLVLGLGKRFAREAVSVLVDLPGGGWIVGGGLGALTVLGAAGWLRCASGTSEGAARLLRELHAVGTAVCCAVTFGPFFLLLSGLPGRNCDSVGCAYVPGTGSALLAYLLAVGAVGWLLRRWTRARAEERAARERQRVRRLRKRGKGKSRAAQGR